ncbi:MAG: helix-turn-helix domain-containing protein [Dermatophilaceae bacterium]
MSTNPTAELLDRYQAEDYLNVSGSTLEKWVRAGLLPVVRLGGQPRSRMRFRRADLDAFIERSTTPAKADPTVRGL